MNIAFLLYHPSAISNWISKLLPYMKGCNVFVLHIAKLHNVKPVSLRDVSLRDVYLKDVSGLSYSKASDLLRELNLDVFIFLSFRSLFELTYYQLCVQQKIKKIYVEHGLFSKDTLRFRKSKLKTDLWATLKRQLSFVYTHTGCIINSYNPLRQIKTSYEVLRNANYKLMPMDHYYLFSRRSFDELSNIFDIGESSSVTYMGYPIFDNADSKKNVSVRDDGGILYVHQPLIADGIASISYNEEKDFLLLLSNKLHKKYGDMTVLLHPRSDLNEYKSRYADTEIQVVQSPNNFKYFIDKSLIIGHYSTALLYGLYFDKNTVVLDYPSTKNDELFSKIFNYVGNINDMRNLTFVHDSSKKDYFLGPNNTFESIAQILMGIPNN